MESITSVLDDLNESLAQFNRTRKHVSKLEQKLMSMIELFNSKKVWLRVFANVDEMLRKLGEVRGQLSQFDQIEALLRFNEDLFKVTIVCKECGIEKLKKDFLLQLKCSCFCCSCAMKRISEGNLRCGCGPFSTEVKAEVVESTAECGGCFTDFKIKLMSYPEFCRKHNFCCTCIEQVNRFSYCFLCGR